MIQIIYLISISNSSDKKQSLKWLKILKTKLSVYLKMHLLESPGAHYKSVIWCSIQDKQELTILLS